MDSLRIDNGIKKIEVNDAGECIEFSINDDKFLTSFWAFGEWLISTHTPLAGRDRSI